MIKFFSHLISNKFSSITTIPNKIIWWCTTNWIVIVNSRTIWHPLMSTTINANVNSKPIIILQRISSQTLIHIKNPSRLNLHSSQKLIKLVLTNTIKDHNTLRVPQLIVLAQLSPSHHKYLILTDLRMELFSKTTSSQMIIVAIQWDIIQQILTPLKVMVIKTISHYGDHASIVRTLSNSSKIMNKIKNRRDSSPFTQIWPLTILRPSKTAITTTTAAQ